MQETDEPDTVTAETERQSPAPTEVEVEEVVDDNEKQGIEEVTATLSETERTALDKKEVSDVYLDDEDSPQVVIDGLTGTMTVEKADLDLAKQQTMEKYATLMTAADLRLAVAEWRHRQAKSLNERKLFMHDLAISETHMYHESSAEINDKESDMRISPRDEMSIYPAHRHQVPGGASSLSISHENDNTQQGVASESSSGIKSMQAPGGASSLSLAHHDGERTPDTVVVALANAMGTDVIVDDGMSDRVEEQEHMSEETAVFESSSGIKSMQAPGGASSLSLAHHDGERTPDTVVVALANAMGTDVIVDDGMSDRVETDSLVSAITESEDPLNVAISSTTDYRQTPGGHSSLTLGHHEVLESTRSLSEEIRNSGDEDKDEDPRDVPSLSDSLNLGLEEKKSDIGASLELEAANVPTTSSSAGAEEGSVSAIGEFEMMTLQMEERVVSNLSQSERFLHVINSSFDKVLNLLCANNNIATCVEANSGIEEQDDHVESLLAMSHFSSSDLTPLRCVVQKSLSTTVLHQCLAIDHSFLLLALREQKLLQHVDFVQAVFLLSDESDFLVNLASRLVDNHIDNNSTMRFTTHQQMSLQPPSKATKEDPQKQQDDLDTDLYAGFDFNLFSSHSVALGFKRAQATSLLPDTSFFSHASIFISDIQSESVTVGGGFSALGHTDMTARERHFCGAFSVMGLDRLTLSYAAPWPFNMIITEEYMGLMSLVTRRILAIAQLTALSRHVWGSLRSCRLQERQHSVSHKHFPRQSQRQSQSHRQHSRKKYERLTYSSFCLIRQTFQAVANFTSDRLRLLHETFRTRLASRQTPLQGGGQPEQQGFGDFAETIRSYIRSALGLDVLCYLYSI